jgi:hypothetical protein
MIVAIVSALAISGSGFTASFEGSAPSLEKFGTVIGYAKRQQKNEGLTLFTIRQVGEEWLFQPEKPSDLDSNTVQQHLFSFMEHIGFDTQPVAASSREQRRRTADLVRRNTVAVTQVTV